MVKGGGSGRVFRVGTGEGAFELDGGVEIEARRFGKSDVYNCRASGDLKLPLADIRRCVADLLRKLAKAAETSADGVPGAVTGIADALTALRLAIQHEKGSPTTEEWWRRHYHELVIQEHLRLWPRRHIMNPHNRLTLRFVDDPPPTDAEIIPIATLRARRRNAEKRRAAAEAARQREIAISRIAQRAESLTIESNGQMAMKL